MIEEIKSQTKKYLQELESLVEINSPESLPFQLSALKDLSLFYLNCSSKIEDLIDNIKNKILIKEKTPLNKEEQDIFNRKSYCIRIHKENTSYDEDRRVSLIAENTDDALKKARKSFPPLEYRIVSIGERPYWR